MKPPFFLLLLGLLSGCATTVTHLSSVDRQLAWQQHQQRLSTLVQWRLTGRMGIQTEKQSLTASLDWSQQQEHYEINLTGSMGSGSLRLSGDNQRVDLVTSKGEQLTATDPEMLIYQHTGLTLPVVALRYWVLGLPAPGQITSQTLDTFGRLARLEQQGWNIDIHRYMQQGELALPAKVFVSNHRAKVRLVIKRWEFQLAETALGAARSYTRGYAQVPVGQVPSAKLAGATIEY